MTTTASQHLSLRPSLLAFRVDDQLQVVFTASGLVKTFAADELAFAMVAALGEVVTISDLKSAMLGVPGYTADHFRDVLAVLDGEGLLRYDDPHSILDAATTERYDRQLRLFDQLCADGVTPAGTAAGDLQLRLARSTVAVIGAGGLGGSVLSALAAAGVGMLRAVDNDDVEVSNLNRQILFASTDVGRAKLTAVRLRLQDMNPDVTVQTVPRFVTSAADLAGIVAGADLVINCADRPDIVTMCDWVSQACHEHGIAHIVGGQYAYQVGAVGLTVLPGRSACWECFRADTATDFDRDRATTLVGRRGPGPAVAMVSGAVGNMLAWEALRVLTGLPPALTDRWGELDMWTLQTHWRPVPRRATCRRCFPDYERCQT
jgi:molybdopterin/thiamine biosynthesis adenylyltransferase